MRPVCLKTRRPARSYRNVAGNSPLQVLATELMAAPSSSACRRYVGIAAASLAGFTAAVFDADCFCAAAPPAPPATAQASDAASALTTKSVLLIFNETLRAPSRA